MRFVDRRSGCTHKSDTRLAAGSSGLQCTPVELAEPPDRSGIVGGYDEEDATGATVHAVRITASST